MILQWNIFFDCYFCQHCIEKTIEELGPNPNLKKMEEVLKNGFVNLKIKNSVVEFRHPFLTKEILETSQLLFKAQQFPLSIF